MKIIIRKQLPDEHQILFFNEKNEEIFPTVQKVEVMKNVIILEFEDLSIKKGRKKKNGN